MIDQPQYERIFGRVVTILATELRVPSARIDKDTLIYEQLGADSLDAVTIALRLEEEFKVEIPDGQIRSFRTPESIAQGIRAYLSH